MARRGSQNPKPNTKTASATPKSNSPLGEAMLTDTPRRPAHVRRYWGRLVGHVRCKAVCRSLRNVHLGRNQQLVRDHFLKAQLSGPVVNGLPDKSTAWSEALGRCGAHVEGQRGLT
eukprot:11216658-Alexandrium_andersonii.AAC.1